MHTYAYDPTIQPRLVGEGRRAEMGGVPQQRWLRARLV